MNDETTPTTTKPTKPAEAKSADVKPTEDKLADDKSVEVKSVENELAEEKVAEEKVAEEKVAEEKHTPTPVLQEKPKPARQPQLNEHQLAARAKQASHSASLTTGLLVGVLALMTFLLSAGLQHPKPMIRYSLITTVVLLTLTLVVNAIAGIFRNARAPKSGLLTTMYLAQQVLFILSVVSIAVFALSAMQLFYAAAAAPAAGSAG